MSPTVAVGVGLLTLLGIGLVVAGWLCLRGSGGLVGTNQRSRPPLPTVNPEDDAPLSDFVDVQVPSGFVSLSNGNPAQWPFERGC